MNTTKSDEIRYGVGDASYRAAGQLPGVIQLVEAFYCYMQTLPEAQGILQLHPEDLALSKNKLAYFLAGWLGGPKLYAEHFGPITIPKVHRHLPVGRPERDAWLLCMERAIADQPYKAAFKTYLLAQLRVPAERVRQACRTVMTWYRLNLGDPLLASELQDSVRRKIEAAETNNGPTEGFGVFARHENSGLHCELWLYFSPSTATIAREFGAEPCIAPYRDGLSLLAGSGAALDGLTRDSE